MPSPKTAVAVTSALLAVSIGFNGRVASGAQNTVAPTSNGTSSAVVVTPSDDASTKPPSTGDKPVIPALQPPGSPTDFREISHERINALRPICVNDRLHYFVAGGEFKETSSPDDPRQFVSRYDGGKRDGATLTIEFKTASNKTRKVTIKANANGELATGPNDPLGTEKVMKATGKILQREEKFCERVGFEGLRPIIGGPVIP